MASVVITDIYRVNKDSLSSVSSQSQVQSNIHKQSKTYLFELRGCLLTNTRETSVSSTGNNKTTKHFKRPPVPRYRWCLMPGCSSWEHGEKTLPFKLKRWLFLSKRVCSSHSGVLSLGDVTCKKNPRPVSWPISVELLSCQEERKNRFNCHSGNKITLFLTLSELFCAYRVTLCSFVTVYIQSH